MRSTGLFVGLILTAFFVAATAEAQSNPSVGRNTATAPTSSTEIGSVDGSGNLQPASTTNPIPVTPVGSGTAEPIIPPLVTAQGTLAVSNSSVALSTLTVSTGSAAWSTTYPSKYVTVRNSVNSTAVLYFCPFGGTCVTSGANAGEPIAIGETIARQLANGAAPTLICGTAAACTAVAEE